MPVDAGNLNRELFEYLAEYFLARTQNDQATDDRVKTFADFELVKEH